MMFWKRRAMFYNILPQIFIVNNYCFTKSFLIGINIVIVLYYHWSLTFANLVAHKGAVRKKLNERGFIRRSGCQTSEVTAFPLIPCWTSPGCTVLIFYGKLPQVPSLRTPDDYWSWGQGS